MNNLIEGMEQHMDKQKKLTKKFPIVLYGGGEVGGKCFKKLKEEGYHIVAALDLNRCGEHVIEGLYTYKLGTEPAEFDKSDCVVVICLANGMIHKTVADKLYSMGYVYIIFLPMNYFLMDKQKRELTRLYNSVLSADSSMIECSVSNYSQYMTPDMSVEGSILQKTSLYMTVWMRLEMLFSESLELWQGDKSKIHTRAVYKDRNIASGNPCEALFDYYGLKLNSCEVYFDSKKEQISQEQKESELRQREELYRLFKSEYEKGMDFFIEGAPEVVWNPSGYCNLVGGHHRTLYLLHKEHSLFPVKIKQDDFAKWYHKTICDELKKYILEKQIKDFYAPLPHPCFLNFPVRWEGEGRTKLADVMKYLGNQNIAEMTVLDCGDDEGYFARNMDRIGAKETVFMNDDIQQIELAGLFCRLLFRQNVKIIGGKLEEHITHQKYDIIFGGSIKGNHISKTFIQHLGMLCKHYLFLETTQSDVVKMIQDGTGLSKYVPLHREFKFGQVWELGVYSE